MAIKQPDDAAVRREIWASFISLAKSYVEAAQMYGSGERTRITEAGPELILTRGGMRMDILLKSAESGEGEWRLSSGTSSEEAVDGGTFVLRLDSKVEWQHAGSSTEVELDYVAETLAGLITDEA